MSEWSGWSEQASDAVLRLIGASDDELDDVVSETLAMMATRCDAERGYVTFYDPVNGTFDISHEWTQGVVPHRPVIQNIAIDGFPWSVGYAQRQQILVVDDLDDVPPEAAPERESFGAFGVRAILQVPIVQNGTTVGVAGLNRFRPTSGWDAASIDFARRVGQAVGIALLRLRSRREIAAARARAEEARRSRDELLAHVSHELRTPLHAILGYAELLELDERSEHDRDALMRIQTNGRYLLGMIDDLAQLARAEPAPEPPATEVGAVVGEIVADLQHVAGDRGLELVGAGSAGTGAVEVGRFRQVARCIVIGAAQSMRDGRIALESEVADGAVTLRARLTSDQVIGRDGLVLPIAEALVNGVGRIDVHADDPGTTIVEVRFDAAIGTTGTTGVAG